MENKPLISVIVPIFNLEKYLEISIPTILKQTYQNIEVLLVDDGSSDSSLAICKDFQSKDNRVKVFSQKNQGAGPARNLGIENAKGKYLYFFDADDQLKETALEILAKEMEKEPVDLLLFGTTTNVYGNDESTIINTVEDALPSLTLDSKEKCRKYWALLTGIIDMGSPWNKLYSKKMIDEYKVSYPSLRRMQDVVFNLYYYDCISSLKIIPTNLYVRTWHSNEVHRKKIPIGFISCAITYHKTAVELNKKWGSYSETCQRYLANSFSTIVSMTITNYLPNNNPTFWQIFKHIRSVTNNEYVANFYSTLGKIKKMRKLEWCISHHLNLVLAVYAYRRNKR